ncbi:RelA/SpoT domain-containing protein [Mesorhizobium sp. WSM4935]|uniref:GTP pyrophosphokinase n=1 Tax=Mesorhizobium sp. WSM4935 TaxID=3038547 RepID=UPI002414F688|nr:RelA/SpoT domain-containing protein [Mesorhizobium sp. WSM4935]MDG4879225.1 RelA/SpoT domain-containing protein [Mesorhizobium sp. WSM4935]
MTTELEILRRWEAEQQYYDAWGRFIVHAVIDGLSTQVEAPDLFLRLPVKHRLKENKSLIQKALYRGKGYASPYDDIEDKVGIRFVVLTSDEIPIVEKTITEFGDKYWFWEKARDFAEERARKPWEFGYQSVHYVVRAKAGIVFEGVPMPLDIPCEIQVRTLLQHAFSEVTHDTIYKPSVKSTPEMMRAAAKAMALIEATDDYFRQVGNLIDASVKSVKALIDALSVYYRDKIGVEATVTTLDGELIEAYLPLAGENSIEDILLWLNTKDFIMERIKGRLEDQTLFALPSILLLYFVVGNFPSIATSPGLLTDEELAPIYSDLGLALPQ